MADCPPVLLIFFNRPHHIARVLDVIRRQKPARLYIAADGPRDPSSHPDDARLCREARQIVTTIDWPCELHTRVSDENQGCGRGPSNAISWFFEHESSGIILEDDCLPCDDFFPYCSELLERYQENLEVMHICGTNFAAPQAMEACSGFSYGFGRLAQVWGWATWARAWKEFKYDVNGDVEDRSIFEINGIDIYRRFAQQERIRSTCGGHRNIWGYQWQFAVLRNGGLAVCPSVNLITNIGFEENATHTLRRTSCRANAPLGHLSFPLSHPPGIMDSPAINRMYADYMLGQPRRYRRKFHKAFLLRLMGIKPRVR